MTNRLPPEIQIVTTSDGELIELPSRYVGCLRVVAVPVIVLGLVFAGGGLALLLFNSGLYHKLSGGIGSIGIAPIILGAMILPAGLVPVALGLFMFGGRNTIELRDEQLIATHRSGPMRWRRVIPMKDLRKFEIKTGNPESSPKGTDPRVGALNVVLDGGARRNLAWGYHKDTLRALADYLAEQCRSRAGATLMHSSLAPIEVEERTIGQDRTLEKILQAKEAAGEHVSDNTVGIPPRPADSTVIYEPHEDGLTIKQSRWWVCTKGPRGCLGWRCYGTALWLWLLPGALRGQEGRPRDRLHRDPFVLCRRDRDLVGRDQRRATPG
ncbi:MAG: hypothetical protein R3C45_06140 [Phycisphaerales bacterium]